ncbi:MULTISPECIES: Na(+)-translocating NADH-quinone reductase subunit C [unclassified Shewanella]|uniref:Na(+)-translocating NADH-quinone reductase subunit C n=1 Tax=unclassified Shewanella TaxID=196818 RepID=UPI000C856D28|nr:MULTISPECIES: Na(+)-translocating NADH-quinone reductase subunit C [unclassified Shewanella]MDO6618969.1 Na(+)-translocating NADH-quinone reductase subunit C [Shewanella sp. 6_MG-2023]MDO6640020.1 Na(+)-translocating NADH-quinone reductase subunit C [Shewanella sp. 5_MG-2023]MDO6677765.1 Na(+)-translocating NADH-quinone reductase subunit C [Shewanella sp. 4_MG-2023]MDO6775044.1 Na(+)-translocating NADH-quinone reductase subunit C [Shewanella sp. 3_MG-2023]PMG26916.1 Na(+)-translocating NADH
MASNKESIGKTLFVVIGLCFICSMLVSTAAVLLKPIQQENKLLDKQKYILEAAGLVDTKAGKVEKDVIIAKYGKYVEARLVDLKTGEFVEGDADTFDVEKAARTPATSFKPENDIASVKRVANQGVVYLVKDDNNELQTVIIPVKGYGLWSTMFAFLAVEADMNTIRSLVYYDFTGSGETPGLGGEVQNPQWIAKWEGKKLYDDNGDLAIQVTKIPTIASSVHGVDALSGATLTSNGVQYSLTFWLGEEGFARFIEKARNGGLG